jgi:hypothetical protein
MLTSLFDEHLYGEQQIETLNMPQFTPYVHLSVFTRCNLRMLQNKKCVKESLLGFWDMFSCGVGDFQHPELQLEKTIICLRKASIWVVPSRNGCIVFCIQIDKNLDEKEITIQCIGCNTPNTTNEFFVECTSSVLSVLK